MSDPNITEKVVEGITNIFKKTILFEKTEKIQGIFIGLTLCTSLFGLFTLYNTYKSVEIENKLNDIDDFIKHNTNLPNVYYKVLLDCQNNVYNITRTQIDIDAKIQNINDNVIKLIEDNKK